MKKVFSSLLILISLTAISQTKQLPENEKLKATEAIMNLQKYYDISEEGTLYQKGTFPRKQDTTKIVGLCSTLDKVTGEDGSEFTSPKVLQKVLYVVTKPNSFSSYIYLDENKKPVTKDYIIWQTKEFPKTEKK